MNIKDLEKDLERIESEIRRMGIEGDKDIEVKITGECWSEADDLDDAFDFLFMEKVGEFDIKFREPLVVTEEEYQELIGKYDSSNGVTDNGITIDQFTYDEDDNTMYKLEFTYRKKGEKLYIYEVRGWREKRK